jgi:hypothetical protein
VGSNFDYPFYTNKSLTTGSPSSCETQIVSQMNPQLAVQLWSRFSLKSGFKLGGGGQLEGHIEGRMETPLVMQFQADLYNLNNRKAYTHLFLL